jgi:hypothetical protein
VDDLGTSIKRQMPARSGRSGSSCLAAPQTPGSSYAGVSPPSDRHPCSWRGPRVWTSWGERPTLASTRRSAPHRRRDVPHSLRYRNGSPGGAYGTPRSPPTRNRTGCGVFPVGDSVYRARISRCGGRGQRSLLTPDFARDAPACSRSPRPSQRREVLRSARRAFPADRETPAERELRQRDVERHLAVTDRGPSAVRA